MNPLYPVLHGATEYTCDLRLEFEIELEHIISK